MEDLGKILGKENQMQRHIKIVYRLIAKIKITNNATSVKLGNCLSINSFQLTLEENICHYITSIQTSISITKNYLGLVPPTSQPPEGHLILKVDLTSHKQSCF